MSAGVAIESPAARPAAPRAAWPRDPALFAAFVAIVMLAALFLAPRPSSVATAATPPPLMIAIADLRGQALVVTDTGNPAGARRIPLPGGPHELVALPGGRLAVSLEQHGAIAIVDAETGEVHTHAVGGTPHGLAVLGDTLYMTDRSANAVRRFAIGTWDERAPIASGAWPHVVASRPDGSLAIANAAAGTLSLGDRALPVSDVPESIAVAPDGRVATAGSVGGALHVFDAGGAPIARHDLGGRPVRLLYDSRGDVLAAALSADGTVAILERDGVRRIAVGGVPDGLAFSADGRWLYVGDIYGGVLSVIDLQRSRVVQRLAVARTAGALLVLPRQ